MSIKIVIALLLLSLNAEAATLCVGPSATGSGSGADWNNIKVWSSTFVRGNTYYVRSGDYTAFADHVFSTAVSSTTLITIKKATVADHGTDTGWDNSYATGQALFGRMEFTTGYWTIDGASRTSLTAGHGIRITQGNGADVINVEGPNVTVLYVEGVGGGNNGDGSWPNNDGISFRTTGNGDNFRIAYSYLRDFGRCVIFCNQNVDDVIIEHCYTGRYESTAGEHSEWASIWGGAGNWTIRYNTISYVEGTGGIIYDNVGHNTDPIYIYGNVFDESLDGPWEASNGVIGGWDSAGAELYNARVFNNTFIGVTVPIFAERDRAGSNGATNNLFYNCSDLGFPDFNHNYNHFISSGGTFSESQGTSGSGDPFTSLATRDYTLTENTTAGLELSSPYNSDPAGSTRTTWTRGAYEFQSGGEPEPDPPSGLRIGTLTVRGTLTVGTQ